MKRRPTFLKGPSLEIRDTGAAEQAGRWKSTEQRGADAPRGGAADTFTPHHVRRVREGRGFRRPHSQSVAKPHGLGSRARLPPGPEDLGAPRQSLPRPVSPEGIGIGLKP